MSLPTLYIGENRVVSRSLKQADGTTALLVSSLTYAAVELRQGTTSVKTLVLGTDAELRQGSGSSVLDVELTAAITALLSPNVNLTFRWKLKVADSSFTVDSGTFIDWQDEEVFTIAA